MLKKLLFLFAMLLSHAAFAATPIDANKGDQAGLESVKGIGHNVATRIVEERKKGNFKSWADLIDRVKGIGKGNASRFSKDGLTVGGVSYTPAPAVNRHPKPSSESVAGAKKKSGADRGERK